MSLEIAFIIGLCLMACVRALAIIDMEYMQSQVYSDLFCKLWRNLNDAISLAANAVIWFVYFTVVYWLAGCVREIFVLKKSYLRERSLCVKFLLWLKNGGNSMTEKIKNLFSDAGEHSKHSAAINMSLAAYRFQG